MDNKKQESYLTSINETWFEYFCGSVIGNLGWWKEWYTNKVPRPEIVRLIDSIIPQIAIFLKTFKDPDR